MIPALLLLATLAVGLLAMRRTRNESDFFVAGRRLGPFRAGLAVAASAFSGFVFLGGPGWTAEIGFGSLLIVVPAGFTAALLCRTVGRRLLLIAEASGAETLPQAVGFRFGGRAPAAVAAAVILFGSVIYLGVQLSALARAAQVAFPGLGLAAGLLLGLLVLLAYSLGGGMVASVDTDVLQGVVMAGAAVAAFWWALSSVSGPDGLVTAVAGGGEAALRRLEPFGVLDPGTGLGFLLLFSVGVLGQPHMLHKFLMLRSPASLRALPAVIGGAQSLSLLVWIGLGAAALAHSASGRLPALSHPDDAALAVMSLPEAPAILAGLLSAAVLAAILSTSDAFLNLGAAALVRDLPAALGRGADGDTGGLRSARGASALVGILAAGVAAWHLAGGGLIVWLGTLGFGVFAAGLAPTMMLGLAWRRVPARAATASMIAGLAALVLLEAARPGFGAPTAAVALGVGAATLVLLTLRSAPRPLPEAVRLALRL